MLRLQGEVVRAERRPWAKDGRNGVIRSARVLVGRADFVDVTLADDLDDVRDGDRVDFAVTANVRNQRLDLRALGAFTAFVPDASPRPLAAAK